MAIRETRVIPVSDIRMTDDDDGRRRIEAVVVAYSTVDTYGEVFDPGCFADSLAERMPRILWSHDWGNPLGRWVDYRDTADSLTLIGEFDDPAKVPMVRQALHQLDTGTIDQFSVGFRTGEDRVTDELDGTTRRRHIVIATMDEASLVIRGAVPGTALVSVRAPAGQETMMASVPLETLIEIGRRKATGELTELEAQAALDLAAIPDPDPDSGDGPDTDPPTVDGPPAGWDDVCGWDDVA